MLKWGWNPKIQGNYRPIQIIKILANRLSACGQISAAYAIWVSLDCDDRRYEPPCCDFWRDILDSLWSYSKNRCHHFNSADWSFGRRRDCDVWYGLFCRGLDACGRQLEPAEHGYFFRFLICWPWPSNGPRGPATCARNSKNLVSVWPVTCRILGDLFEPCPAWRTSRRLIKCIWRW